MDGRGRVFDNIFSERLWRTVKYEEVYLKDYAAEARRELRRYFRFYNQERLHQALDYHTPAEVYEGRLGGVTGRPDTSGRTVVPTRRDRPTGSFHSGNRNPVRLSYSSLFLVLTMGSTLHPVRQWGAAVYVLRSSMLDFPTRCKVCPG